MLSKLTRQTLTDQAAQSLMQFIQSQDLQPGDVMPSEANLAEQLGVSRPVIREALRSLEGRGIVEIVNGKGAVIRPIDSDTLLVFFQRALRLKPGALIELLEVRKGIEVEGARLAAQRRTSADISELTDITEEMRDVLHDPDRYVELDLQFHLTIASATHNSLMYHLVESIRETIKEQIREGLRSRTTEEELNRVQAQHDAILDALKRGDADEAADVMAQHFDESIMALIRYDGDYKAKITSMQRQDDG